MPPSSTALTNPPANLWIDAQTIILPIHEDLLNTVLSSVCGDDLILRLYPALGIQDLNETETTILMMVFSEVDLGWDGSSSMMIQDENSFGDIESTIDQLGFDVAISRLIVVDVAVRDSRTLAMLRKEFAKHPVELGSGLLV